MKKLSKEQMKQVIGGVMAPSGGWCSATVNCADGTTRTLVCENSQAGCVGIDADDGKNGYAYCQEQDGSLTFNSCNAS